MTNKPKHIWSVLCRESSIDKDSNVLSLHGVFEQLGIHKEQVERAKEQKKEDTVTLPINLELVNMWEREGPEKTTIEAKIVALDPHGTKLFEKEYPVTIEQGKRRTRFRMKMNGLKITCAGTYLFKVAMRENKGGAFRTVAALPLEVRFTE